MGHVFISHSGHDEDVVTGLRNALDDVGLEVFTFLGTEADKPDPGTVIDQADGFLVVLSVQAVNAAHLRDEVRRGLGQRRRRRGYKVIAVLLEPIAPSSLPLWFGDEQVAVVRIGGGRPIEAVLPAVLRALEVPIPDGVAGIDSEPKRLADLKLELTEIEAPADGGAPPTARAVLRYRPPDGSAILRTEPFRFEIPDPTVSRGEVAWYFRRFSRWPSEPFRERARDIERRFDEWGRKLFEALGVQATGPVFEAWRSAGSEIARRFTLVVEPVGGSPAEHRAATRLLGLPWELVRDGDAYVFHGRWDVGVRRRVPEVPGDEHDPTSPPIRVLLVTPRPDDIEGGAVDHRITADPLVEALSKLGELAALTLLTPATFEALAAELRRARASGEAYHVVHFDGHGILEPATGQGALLFEDPADVGKVDGRRAIPVSAAQLAAVLVECRVPLVVLEARGPRQVGSSGEPSETGVLASGEAVISAASQLFQAGVPSVVPVSRSLPQECVRRFVAVFYRELMSGRRISLAGLASQRLLQGDPFRSRSFSGEVLLADWWVPMLFQGRHDPRLLMPVPADRLSKIMAQRRRPSLGRTPDVPAHGFVGRSRTLLRAERLLQQRPYVVLHGAGGQGKTTLAAELARWLVATEHFHQAAYVSLESHSDARSVRDSVGQQLVPRYRFAASQDLRLAIELLERVLSRQPTLLVFDHLESLMSPPAGTAGGLAALTHQPKVLEQILSLCEQLGRIGRTRLVFASRERLPAPFADHHLEIGRLDRHDAISLVARVLARGEVRPPAADSGRDDEEIAALVESVGGHPRSLVLLAGEVAASGVRGATSTVGRLREAWRQEEARAELAGISFAERVAIELALRRLPADERQRIRPLAMFQGGGHLTAISSVLELEVEEDEEVALAEQLIGLGLAEMLPYNYLRLDPALGPLLGLELLPEERDELLRRWIDAVVQLAEYLFGQQVKDPGITTTLALLDLPNLLACLDRLRRRESADRVTEVAATLESLVEVLGRPKALEWIEEIRRDAVPELDVWTRARFRALAAEVEGILESERSAEAVSRSKLLLARAEAGLQAYDGAAADLARSRWILGRAHLRGGNPAAALVPLDDASRELRRLAETGDRESARLAAVSMALEGDCLMALDRWDAAVERYETAIGLSLRQEDRRHAAEVKTRLGTLHLDQGRPEDALRVFDRARAILEESGGAAEVAGIWRRIGVACERAQRYEEAEKAYRSSLAVELEARHRAHVALTLTDLGSLYDTMGRLEDAVTSYREAAEIFVDLGDLAREGIARSNAADRLMKLDRWEEAREEILRTMECDKPFGHAAEPWRTYSMLLALERAVGRDDEAVDAHRRATRSYYEYRRSGGESQTGHAEIFVEVGAAIAAGDLAAERARLAKMRDRANLPAHLAILIPVFEALLGGSRDRALATDPHLHYRDAAELLLLLDRLESP